MLINHRNIFKGRIQTAWDAFYGNRPEGKIQILNVPLTSWIEIRNTLSCEAKLLGYTN